MSDINFEKDQEEVLDRTENLTSLADQVKKLRDLEDQLKVDEETLKDKKREAKKISAQKSQIVNKDNGEIYDVLNRNFVEWIRKFENKEAHAYCKNKVKESLIIEQDPLKRQEEITTEELDTDEVL